MGIKKWWECWLLARLLAHCLLAQLSSARQRQPRQGAGGRQSWEQSGGKGRSGARGQRLEHTSHCLSRFLPPTPEALTQPFSCGRLPSANYSSLRSSSPRGRGEDLLAAADLGPWCYTSALVRTHRLSTMWGPRPMAASQP